MYTNDNVSFLSVRKRNHPQIVFQEELSPSYDWLFGFYFDFFCLNQLQMQQHRIHLDPKEENVFEQPWQKLLNSRLGENF